MHTTTSRRVRLAAAVLAASLAFSGLIANEAPAATPAPATTITTPYIRANDALHDMRLDPKGRFLAFAPEAGFGISVIDIKTKAIWKVSDAQIGASFFWSPDGYRLFYRELLRSRDGSVKSVVKAYDCYLNRSVVVDEVPYPTGILTFDPRDLRFHMMTTNGIRTRRIYFPDERLAKWQIAQRDEQGKWLATQAGMLWVTQGGYAIRRLEDDGDKLESFAISPDGKTLAWATKSGKIYVSTNGKKPRFFDNGRDPKWHPRKPMLLYAGARMVGNKAINYDIKIQTLDGVSRFLTATQYSNERWPQWHPKGSQILYTVDRTTDVFLLDFKQ